MLQATPAASEYPTMLQCKRYVNTHKMSRKRKRGEEIKKDQPTETRSDMPTSPNRRTKPVNDRQGFRVVQKNRDNVGRCRAGAHANRRAAPTGKGVRSFSAHVVEQNGGKLNRYRCVDTPTANETNAANTPSRERDSSLKQ
jgi:hypothetical protein